MPPKALYFDCVCNHVSAIQSAMATPEQKAREIIDAQLSAAGWIVQDREEMSLGAGLGVAVRECDEQD